MLGCAVQQPTFQRSPHAQEACLLNGSICAVTKREFPFNAGAHVMLAVIGTSFTVENGLKGLYETTIGRLSEWTGTTNTPEDAFAQRVALEYGRFMHTVPWYEFPFAARLKTLWKETPTRGPHFVRKWERRFALTAEYGAKAAYGWVICAGERPARDHRPPEAQRRGRRTSL